MMNICDKCGKELSENAVFCDQCGNKVTAQPKEEIAAIPSENILPEKTPTKKSSRKLIIIIAAAAVLLIAGAVFLGISIANEKKTEPVSSDTEIPKTESTDTKKSEKEPEKKTDEMTEAERLRYEYFYGDTGIHINNAAETLVRNEDIFLGAKIIVSGRVSTILPTDTSDIYSLSVSDYNFSNDKYTNVRGKFYRSKQYKDLILLYGFDDELIATDLSGNIIWRNNYTSDSDGNYKINNVQIINDEILVEYTNLDYEAYYYCRMNIENGELLNSLEL